MPKTQSYPALTVYRSGLVNLNGEATRLMHGAHLDVDLLPPLRGSAPWQLDRRAGSPARLAGGHGRGILRFRAPGRADALFAELPAETTRVTFEVLPVRNGLELYQLVTVQQNLFR